jgi:phospholipase C
MRAQKRLLFLCACATVIVGHGTLIGVRAAQMRRGPDAPGAAAPSPVASPLEPAAVCPHAAGSLARHTLPGARDLPGSLPIKHVIVLMQENRSYDHYFGRLSAAGQPDAEPIPASYGNRDPDGHWVAPFHLPSTCVPGDPPHQWENMRAHFDGGRMDGFIAEAARGAARRASRGLPPRRAAPGDDGDDDDVSGRYALGYYDATDLPFYAFLANTFTIGDRYFSPVMAGTWPNRQFLYTGTAQGRRAATGLLLGARTIFDNLTAAGVSWGVYTDGPPRQDCIGWSRRAPGLRPLGALFAALRAGDLPSVAFVDASAEDEHPPADVQRGEAWVRRLYLAVRASPLWGELVLFVTYDEGGGFFDHVPPPPACAPDGARGELDRRGTRVPLLVVSPWARRHHVSHVVHDHTSLLRFVELLFDLPALSARDANADALLDAFDFGQRPAAPPPPPAAGHGGCRPARLLAAR